MSDESSIRRELEKAATNHGEISKIARDLEINPSTVSRWASGNDIPSPMLKLLDLYFFGTIPFEISHERPSHGTMDFTEDQWRVIEILSRRESTTPGKWIANKIRAYLAYNEEAKLAQEAITKQRKGYLQSLPDPIAKVAKDTPPYRTGEGKV